MKIWTLSHGHLLQSGAKTVKIASYLAQSIFNEGYDSLLIMNIIIRPNAVALCTEVDDTRNPIADARSFKASKEGRVERRVMSRDVPGRDRTWSNLTRKVRTRSNLSELLELSELSELLKLSEQASNKFEQVRMLGFRTGHEQFEISRIRAHP